LLEKNASTAGSIQITAIKNAMAAAKLPIAAAIILDPTIPQLSLVLKQIEPMGPLGSSALWAQGPHTLLEKTHSS
jgi:hypothetical protein